MLPQLQAITMRVADVSIPHTVAVLIITHQLLDLIMKAVFAIRINLVVVQMALLQLKDLTNKVNKSILTTQFLMYFLILGCDCRSTQYGCCTDDRTPSSGPNYEGCTCAASKFGCCPDGVTEAQGNKFEGCDNVPENMQGMTQVFLCVITSQLNFSVQNIVIWIKTEDHAEITQYGGTLIWLMVVALDFGMVVVMVIETVLKLKRNVKVFVLKQLVKVNFFYFV